MVDTAMKISRFLLPTLGAAAGAGAYVLAGGKWGGTAFLLIMHCGMLVGWVANRMLQSATLATGHLTPPDQLGDDAADALIDKELEQMTSEGDGDDDRDDDHMVVTT
jgi:hypothetical protein